MMKRGFSVLILSLALIIGLITSGCGAKTSSSQMQAASEQTGISNGAPIDQQVNAQEGVAPGITFQWGELKDDLLSPKGLITDGKPDAHFILTMAFPEEVKIKYIMMRYAEFGKHVQWAWAYNKNLPIVGAPLAIFQNGTLVANGTDIGLTASGNVVLDVYAPEQNNEDGISTLTFAKGDKISIQVNYINKAGEEKKYEATATVNI